VGKANGPDLIITHNGAEVLECLYGDGIWQIECCSLKLSSHCSMLQKDIKHYCKAKIISKQIDYGIHVPCYVGYWSPAQGVSIELHKFWFCHDDLMHCVGRTSSKYALNRPTLPSLWLMQERIDLTQIEVVALEEASFLLLKKPICPFVNPIGDDIFALMKQPPECAFQNSLEMVLCPCL
jgi:hypothetical protein